MNTECFYQVINSVAVDKWLARQGKRMAVPAEETTEIDTPYGVKVAMLRREAQALPELANLLKEGALTTRVARDTQILNYLASLPVAA